MATFLVGELELFKGQNAVMKALGGHLESVSRAEYEELLVKLADGARAEDVISDDLVDELAIVGTPDECAAALKRYADAGITEAGLSPIGMDPVQAAALVADEIRPRLADA